MHHPIIRRKETDEINRLTSEPSCKDEARIGQKNKITRRWAKRGSRTSAPRDQRTASTYIFGAVCPEQGKGAGLILPACNTEAMNLHLIAIAAAVAPGAHAVLLADQAGWHMIGSPDEGLWLLVVVGDEAIDGGLEIDDAFEDAALEAPLGEDGEETLDGVEPTGRGGREMEASARMTPQPFDHLGVLVSGVVVEDGVDRLAGRDSARRRSETG